MILIIYSKEVCREILLPAVYDAYFPLLLKKEDYHLQMDVSLALENVQGKWYLNSGDAYVIKIQNQITERQLLADNFVKIEADHVDLTIMLEKGVNDFPVMEKYDLRACKMISIGSKDGKTIQYQFRKLVSGDQANIRREGAGWVIYDLSANGTFVDHVRINKKRQLSQGDQIDIFGLRIVFMYPNLLVSNNCGDLLVNENELPKSEIENEIPANPNEKHAHDAVFYNRAPRNYPVIYKDPVEIEAPPAPKIMKQKPLYMTIGPAFSMAIPMTLGMGLMLLFGRSGGGFMFFGMFIMIGSAIVGAFWAYKNYKYSQKEQEEEENLRFNAYSNYVMDSANKIKEMYIHNTKAMNTIYPSAAELIRYDSGSIALWNRNASHEDFLNVRLGLGNVPFQVEINVPKEKFTLVKDDLANQPNNVKQEYQMLRNVPITINLMQKMLVGITGGKDRQGCYEMMRTLVTGIAAAHSYTDVKLVFIYDEKDLNHLNDFESMRWFPHVWSEDKSMRYMAANEVEIRDVFFALSNIIRNRAERAEKGFVKPHYVVFVADPSLLEGELLTKYMYEPQPQYGITTFLMVESMDQLPNACETVIQYEPSVHCLYNLMDEDVTQRVNFNPETVSSFSIETFGRNLANIHVREIEESSEIPDSLTFMEMYNATKLADLNVLENWRKNRTYNSMKALIGRKAGNTDCYLDIHEKFHGPHGLLAGTTGSGKSETLQTYIVSMAVNYSPEDVSFLIIDYKGGGMADLFTDLPHLAGKISNLSGNQVQRALISINSEKVRREAMFARAGVTNIDGYTKLFKNHDVSEPLPHLFIVIDEFAELKSAESDFMDELISVSQVGRSLGVHLILATQKPQGTVSENIRSNAKFRLCLRVQTRGDSMDMLEKTDAAYLTRPGRCYLQVGNDEIYELFQSGYSGAPYQEGLIMTSCASMISRTGKADLIGTTHRTRQVINIEKPKSQLGAVIDYLGEVAKKNGYRKTQQLWQPVLGKTIHMNELPMKTDGFYDGKGWKNTDPDIQIAVGKYDDPYHQMQDSLIVNFTQNGHLAVLGNIVSGKSTFLQTMVFGLLMKYSPDDLQMYLLDYSGNKLAPFAMAPHVGGVVTDSDEDGANKLFYMLNQMMDRRKKIVHGGNFSQYIRKNGKVMPAVLIVIDGFSSFQEKTAEKHNNTVMRLAKEGMSYGMYLAVASLGIGAEDIPTRLNDNVKTKICLELSDPMRYSDYLKVRKVSLLPEPGVQGRGLALVDEKPLEFQTALSVKAADDYARGELLEKISTNMAEHWQGAPAKPIPRIPENFNLSHLLSNDSLQEALDDPYLLPFGLDANSADLVSIRLPDNYFISISGSKETGKMNMLKVLIHMAYAKHGEIVVFEKTKQRGELQTLTEQCGGKYITDGAQLHDYLSNDLKPKFISRNTVKKELIAKEMDDEEIAVIMVKEKPIFIFIANTLEFLNTLENPEAGVGKMSPLMGNLAEKGRLHHIYFFGACEDSQLISLKGKPIFDHFTAKKKGFHFGGNLDACSNVMDANNLSYKIKNEKLKKGYAWVSSDTEADTVYQATIPLAKVKK